MSKTTKSNEYADQVAAAASFNERLNDERLIGGNVKYATVKVVIAALNVATDVITLIELPTGAIVLPELSKVIVTDDATSGALTLDIGDATDVDRYADGINAASAGEISFTSVASTTVPDGLHNRHKLTADTNILQVTLATFTATIEAGEIIFVIAYKTL
jgi:hypothetical protein